MPSLTRAEAAARAEAITVLSMEVALDLTGGAAHFGSRAQIRFEAIQGATTFVDVRAQQVHRIELDGVALDPSAVQDGRLSLSGLGGATS